MQNEGNDSKSTFSSKMFILPFIAFAVLGFTANHKPVFLSVNFINNLTEFTKSGVDFLKYKTIIYCTFTFSGISGLSHAHDKFKPINVSKKLYNKSLSALMAITGVILGATYGSFISVYFFMKYHLHQILGITSLITVCFLIAIAIIERFVKHLESIWREDAKSRIAFQLLSLLFSLIGICGLLSLIF